MDLSWLIPVLILLGLVVSALGSISGVGGGVLFVPILMQLFAARSFEEIKFVSTLLVFAGSMINVIIELVKKRFSWILLATILAVALPTIFLGMYLSKLIPQNIGLIIVISLLIVVTILLAFNTQLNNYFLQRKLRLQKEIVVEKKPFYYLTTSYGLNLNLFKIVVITFLAGLITTMTGMGGGPILMPLLLLTCALTMKKAAPISHLIIAITSLITLGFSYQYFTIQDLNLTLSLPMFVGVVGGTLIAAKFKNKIKNENFIKWILILLIVATIVKMIIDLV